MSYQLIFHDPYILIEINDALSKNYFLLPLLKRAIVYKSCHRGTAADMPLSPADILTSSSGFEDFRESIIALKGDFPFEPEDMEQLGRVYFIRYSDTSVDRNMENIRMGYRIVRTCIAEKILDGIDNRHRDTVRCMLEDLSLMEEMLAKLIKENSIEDVEIMLSTIERNLDRIKRVIDELPRGMTKERFVGGISKFYNEMYLLKESIREAKSSG